MSTSQLRWKATSNRLLWQRMVPYYAGTTGTYQNLEYIRKKEMIADQIPSSQ